MVAHASLGASNAHRWLYCAGSVEAERDIPETSSPFAEEGTRAHDLAEALLKGDPSPTQLDAEMLEYVRVYTDYVNAASVGADLVLVEQRVVYDAWVPNGFGTADAVIIKGDTLHVCDLKYGMGVQVHAENNPQGMLYALGAYAENKFFADFTSVKISIVQPRLDHISEWEISIPDLLRWAEWVSQRAEATQAEDAERTPGNSQCRFCKAKATCAALMRHTEAVIMADFDNLDDIAPANKLTDDQLRQALDAKPLIEGWLSAVEGQIKDRLERGDGFDGWKLVEGRSIRKWSDDTVNVEAKLIDLLGNDAFAPQKLISPAQAEKALGKQKSEVSDLIVKPAGKPTLAPESDKRPAINLTDDDFDHCGD